MLMILPPGHGVAIRRRLAPRERRLVTGVLGLGAVLVAVLVIALVGTGGEGPRRGCVDVSFPSTLGVQEVVRCGSAARRACAAVGTSSGFSPQIGRLVAADCRRLGLPVG